MAEHATQGTWTIKKSIVDECPHIQTGEDILGFLEMHGIDISSIVLTKPYKITDMVGFMSEINETRGLINVRMHRKWT